MLFTYGAPQMQNILKYTENVLHNFHNVSGSK